MRFVYILLVAVVVHKLSNSWLLQPLPSNLLVSPVPKDKVPRPLSLISYAGIKIDRSLVKATRLYQGKIQGPESVFVGKDGNLVILDRYGNIYSAPSDDTNSSPKLIKYIGPGRPLGFHLISGTNTLVVCDSLKGLLSVDLDSQDVHILTSSYISSNGTSDIPFEYANDLDISKDGSRVYFSSSSSIPPYLNREGYYDTMQSYLLTAMSGRPTGKLLSYNIHTKSTIVLVDGIFFANGVALSQDESFVLVAETVSMRIIRCWLKGPKAGTTDVFADRILGYPDGIARSSDGSFYVAVVFLDNAFLRSLLNAHPMVRWALSWISQLYKPLPKKMGIIIQV